MKQYDVKINNQGYILRPGSYTKKKMPNSSLQFRTGDIEYSHLTAWQYFGQSDWRGGAGQKLMAAPDKYRYAQPMKTTEQGEIKLPDNMVSLSFQASLHHTGLKFGSLWYLGGSAGLYSFNGGTTFTQKKAVTATFYSSEEFNGSIYFSHTGTTVEYSADGTTWNTPLTKSGYWLKKAHNRLYLAGAGKALYSWDGSAWTTEFTSKEWEVYGVAIQGRLLLMLCMDGSDRVALRAYDGTTDFTIKIWESSAVSTLVPNGIMVVRENDVYFTLQTADKKRLFFYKFDGGMVTEIFKWTVGNSETPSGLSYSGAFTIENNGIAVIDDEVILNIRWDGSTDYFNVHIFDKDDNIHTHDVSNGDYSNANLSGLSWPIAIGRDILYSGATVSTNNSYMTQRQAVDQKYRSSGSIVFSIWDFDLFSLDKYFSGLNIYHDLLPANTSYTVQVRIDGGSWSTAASNSTANSTGLEIQFLTGNVGKKIEVRLNLATSDNVSTPKIQDVVLRYILNPQIKWQWQFDLLLTRGLKKKDGTMETTPVENLISFLNRAISYNSDDANDAPLIKFADIDSKVYDFDEAGVEDKGVIFEDLEILGPFSFGEDGPEYVARCALIEG